MPEGSYQLKVTDGTWNNCWGINAVDSYNSDEVSGSDNVGFVCATGDVTIIFVPATYKIRVKYTGVNINTAADDSGAEWYAVEDFLGAVVNAGDNVTFTYSKIDKTVTVALATGIETIETATSESVVYNAIGQRVDANSKGFKISGKHKQIVR